MNLSDLLSKGLVEKFQSDSEQIKKEMDIAKNDITSAKKMLTIQECGWTHNAAYNAVLQAGRALMFSKGYRPEIRASHGRSIICRSGLFD
jgi:uncharacterized protein (UPF0332 family)